MELDINQDTRLRDTYCESVDHGLEAHVHLAASDDFSHIGRVIGLQESDLEALILEIASRLSEVKGGVVRGGVP